MPPAYLIVTMHITDPEQYKKYMAEAQVAVKAAGGDPDAIVFGLKARLHLFPPDPQFIPNPATWLNQGRWDDDPDTLFARTQRSN